VSAAGPRRVHTPEQPPAANYSPILPFHQNLSRAGRDLNSSLMVFSIRPDEISRHALTRSDEDYAPSPFRSGIRRGTVLAGLGWMGHRRVPTDCRRHGRANCSNFEEWHRRALPSP